MRQNNWLIVYEKFYWVILQWLFGILFAMFPSSANCEGQDPLCVNIEECDACTGT